MNGRSTRKRSRTSKDSERPGSTGRRTPVAGLAVVGVLLAGAVLSGWWWQREREPAPPTKPAVVSAAAPGQPGEGGLADRETVPPQPAAPPQQTEAVALKLEAVTVARRVAEVYPDDALSQVLLGSAYYNTGQSEEATRHLHRSLELNPDQAEAYEILARVAYEKGELEESARLGEEAVRRGAVHVEVLNQLGRAWLDLGRAGSAVAILEQATRLRPPSSESFYLLGQAQLQGGDAAGAKTSFQRAVALLPDHTQAVFGLFTACVRLGEADEARTHRERFLELEAIDRQTLTDRSAREDVLSGLPMVRATVARTLFGAAQIYAAHQEPAKAAEFYFKAALLDEEAPLYRAALEALFVRRNAPAHGVRLFEQLAAAQPDSAWNHLFLGRLQQRSHQMERAEASYRRVIELAPGWPDGHGALAELYLADNRKLAEARTLAHRAVELDPTAPRQHLLAVARWRTGDRAGAIAALRRAVELDPEETGYREFLERLEAEP